MREQRFACKKGDYYVTVTEDDNGVVTARDFFCDKDGLESARYDSWDEAIITAKRCIDGNEGYYDTPVSETPLSDDGKYVCRYAVTDLNETAVMRLKELLSSGKDFDTGFGSSSKEFESVRFYARGDTITIFVAMEMDDIPDLFLDAIPNNVYDKISDKLGESFEDDVMSLYTTLFNGDVVILSETTAEEEIPRNSTYEEVMTAVLNARNAASTTLDESYSVAKAVVKEYLVQRSLWDDSFDTDFMSR